MAQRFNSFFNQLLQDTELDAIGDGLQQADWDMIADHGFVGITTGGAVVQHSPTADLTVDVPALTAYDSDGRRIRVPSLQRVDVSVDHLSVSTDVAVPGNEKIVSLFAFFDRDLTDPRIDGNGVTVYWNEAEGFGIKVVQGAESAAPATPPALEADKVLLCDIRRANPQTQILNTDITPPGGSYAGIANRRQDAFVLSSGSLKVRVGTAEKSDQALLDLIEPLTAASGIAVAASGEWHDGTDNLADDLQARIDKIISDLAGETTGDASAGGAFMIGHKALPDWNNGGGTPRTRPAGSIYQSLVLIAIDLEDVATGDDGAVRIGSEARTGATVNLSEGTVASQLQEVIDELGGLTTSNTWTNSNEFDAAVQLDGAVSVSSTGTLEVRNGATAEIESGATLEVQSGGGFDLQNGSTATVSTTLDLNGANAGIEYRPGALGDANANLDVGTDEYIFTTPPTVARTFTLLDSTGNTPVDGQRIRVVQSAAGPPGGSAVFQRETGGTTLATFPSTGGVSVEFTYHSHSSLNGWYVSSAAPTVTVNAVT